MKVIILAAGIGSRLRDIWKDKPKPLFEIKGKTLIEYSLDALIKVGVNKIVIVVGYKREMIKDKIKKEYKGTKIEYAENKLYEITGSMHSVYSVFKEKEPEDCLVLDADIVYDPNIIVNLINYEKKDVAFLTSCCGSGDETFTVLDESEKIIYLRLKKNEDPNLLKGKKVFEFNGVAKFSKEFLKKMLCLHEEKIRNNKLDSYYEECALEVNKEIPWYGLVNKEFVLAEIDKKEDIKRAEKIIRKYNLI